MAANYGTLTDSQTGDPIRPATREELMRSLRIEAEDDSGAFLDDDGRTVYVARDHDDLESLGLTEDGEETTTYRIETISGRGLPSTVDAEGYDTREAAEAMADAEHDGEWRVVADA